MKQQELINTPLNYNAKTLNNYSHHIFKTTLVSAVAQGNSPLVLLLFHRLTELSSLNSFFSTGGWFSISAS